MSALVTEHLTTLAATLAGLKTRVRAALASEMGKAFGAAVRDVLTAALVGRLIDPMPQARRVDPYRPPAPRTPAWRDDPDAGRDPWADDPDDDPDRGDRAPARFARAEPDECEPAAAVPVAAVAVVGMKVGRWWLARHGTLVGALGAGTLAAVLGLVGGSLARAVMAAAADLLTAAADLGAPTPV